MPRSYRYLHLDVFTSQRFGGNQLAVFLDGRGLATQDMQAIANEMNFSESTFVLPPDAPGTDMRVRIFTPAEELPMAGHPTIGTAFALARSGAVSPPTRRVVFGLGVGPTPVDLTWKDDLVFAWMTQPAPTFGEPLADGALAATTLRLIPAAVTATGLPVQPVSCGVPYLIVPLATRADVDAATLDPGAYDQLGRTSGLGSIAIYLYSAITVEPFATVHARMFAPSIGITEDPATGSAAGALGSYLVHHGVVDVGPMTEITIEQGYEIERPSRILVQVESDDDAIQTVKVGGQCVMVVEGTLSF